ncbi:hypothetical protein J2T58_001804 [Methanocalculus alkaliphilus]|nr:hypothetical protein [Methanocalculus alkaliphilus]MCP1715930.1 hypothetical protein [Methanocalculus alkaliphilus]
MPSSRKAADEENSRARSDAEEAVKRLHALAALSRGSWTPV